LTAGHGSCGRTAARSCRRSNHPLWHPGRRRHPGNKAALERFGVEGVKDVAQTAVGRRAVPEAAEPAQQRQLLAAEPGDIDNGLGAGQHGEQAE